MNTISAPDRFEAVKEHFQKIYQDSNGNLNGHSQHSLHQWRKKAAGRLEAVAFPGRRNEDWKYTSAAKMLQPEYREGLATSLSPEELESFTIDGLDAYRLVFVNGQLDEQLSDTTALPKGVRVLTFFEALDDERFRDYVTAFYEKNTEGTSEAFSVLNAALGKSGYLIHVEKDTAPHKPIHLLHLAGKSSEESIICPQLVVEAEAGSRLVVVESFRGAGEGVYLRNVLNSFHVHPNAALHHFKIQHEGQNAYMVNTTEVAQEQDSNYSGYALDLGGNMVRNNLRSFLKGTNTTTNFYGVYMATGRQHIDNQSFIDHALPHCYSNELYKGIIDDRARGVFNGKVLVRQDAQKTNAYQQNATLVLSETATMDTKPQLEIFADDVRCSHGATIGQLDEESIFYLRSRGLSDRQARSLLQHAFLLEVLENVEEAPVREFMEQLINQKFES